MRQVVINSASPQTFQTQAPIYTGRAGASCSHVCRAEADLGNPVGNLWDELREKGFHNRVLASLTHLKTIW